MRSDGMTARTTLVALAIALAVVLAGPAGRRLGGLDAPGALAADRSTQVVDAVLAIVDGAVITASDIALARALGLYGFTPSTHPIDVREVERYVRVQLVTVEAGRLAITPAPDRVEEMWRAIEARAGGATALETWLAANGIDRSWARRAVEAHERWQRFIELRFVEFTFVSPDEVTAALGPGEHGTEAEERVRARLRRDKSERALTAWVDTRVREATIARVLRNGETLPVPFLAPQPAPRSRDRDPGRPVIDRGGRRHA
jgi:hypothetical protein